LSEAIQSDENEEYFLGTVVLVKAKKGGLRLLMDNSGLQLPASLCRGRDLLILLNREEAPIYGHPKATRAYTWSSPIEGSTKRRFFAVLHMGAIKSPADAVRAAIVGCEHREVR
jgi:hypothetical protein